MGLSSRIGLMWRGWGCPEGRKQFFFEKKNQKTFSPWLGCLLSGKGMKVFLLLFLQKKKILTWGTGSGR